MYGQSVAGVARPPLIDADRRLVVANGGGKWTETALAGRLYTIANQAAVALTAALATTYTGLLVSNPVGSAVNLIMAAVGVSATLAMQKAGAIGLMTGSAPTTAIAASLVPRNCLVGGPAGVARATAGCDLTGATPVLERILGQYGTLATTGFGVNPWGMLDLDGSLILQPGGYVAVYGTLDSTAALIASFMWEERLRA